MSGDYINSDELRWANDASPCESLNADRILVGIELHVRRIGHMHPDMHVRVAAVVPDERRFFKSSVVPNVLATSGSSSHRLYPRGNQ